MGAQQISILAISSDHAEKAKFADARDNNTKARNVHADGNKHCPRKE